MKKGIILLGMLFGMITTTFAAEAPTLAQELNKKVIVDLSDVSLDQDEKNMVVTRFKVVDGCIEIIALEGTSEELKEIFRKKLQSLKIESECADCDTYVFHFVVEKE